MVDFNKVVIRDTPKQEGNIHLSVHPFRVDSIHMMSQRGEYGHDWKEPIPPWQRLVADALWDSIPGLTTLFFQNGKVTLQHSQVFPDHEIAQAAKEVLTPFLENNLNGAYDNWVENREEREGPGTLPNLSFPSRLLTFFRGKGSSLKSLSCNLLVRIPRLPRG
ncbi:hypothetical protein LCGC14_1174890 [marine sediment metagenome]|uniref:Uncharacterized protein n=1 Tax=marine sediment metagenome TaxID=412755 RepID=A0A0F9PU95_9ZZZZ